MQTTLEKCTHMLVVTTAHSNIPATSQSDQELNKNHTGSQEPVVVRLPAGPSTSNLLQAKANGKSPTIVTPSITALHQSRPPTTEFQAAVTNERPVGTRGTGAERTPCIYGSTESLPHREFRGNSVSQDSGSCRETSSGKRDYRTTAKV